MGSRISTADEERLLKILRDRGYTKDQITTMDIAELTALDSSELRWGPRIGALVRARVIDDIVVQNLANECGIDTSEILEGAVDEEDASVISLPGYQLIRPLGRGASGDVFVALDQRLGRQVALKILRSSKLLSASRFHREARTQAHVVHDNICQVYETGIHKGRAFIAMRLIDGPSLDKAGPNLPIGEKVRMARDLALALEEAHRQNVIHRDIKPANVLIERLSDGRLRPVLTDFGIARNLNEFRDLTIAGAIVGTPAYMSPEQARGRPVDPRTDVYGLGATLYDLVVGAPPFAGDSTLDVINAVANDDPPPPRTRVRDVPRDLETIVLKCLAKDAADRYRSARALADDLDRFIAGQPLHGRRMGLRWAWRQFRRHRYFFVGAAIIGIAISLGVLQLQTSERETRRRSEHARVESLLEQAEQALGSGRLVEARAGLRTALEVEDTSQARALWGHLRTEPLIWTRPRHGVIVPAISADDRVAVAGSGTIDLVENGTSLVSQSLPLPWTADYLALADLSADGSLLAVGSRRGSVGVFRVPSGDYKDFGRYREWAYVLFSPDDHLLAVLDAKNHVNLLDPISGQPLRILLPPPDVKADRVVGGMAFSADGRQLAAAFTDETIVVWDVALGAVSQQLRGPKSTWYYWVAFGPDGTLASVGGDEPEQNGLVTLWNVADGTILAQLAGHLGPVLAVAFSPDGAHLATAGVEPGVLIWDLANARVEQRLDANRGGALSLAYSADGRRLLCAWQDAVDLYDVTVAAGDARLAAPGLVDPVHLAIAPDGKHLVVSEAGGAVREWDVTSAAPKQVLSSLGSGADVRYRHDGAGIAFVGKDRSIYQIERATMRHRLLALRTTAGASSFALGPGERTIAVADDRGVIKIVDTGSGAETQWSIKMKQPGLAFSVDGSALAAVDGEARSLLLWDVPSGREPSVLPEALVAEPTAVALAGSDDGAIVVASSSPTDGIQVWDSRTSDRRGVGRASGRVLALCLGPNGKSVVSLAEEGRAQIWRLGSMEPLKFRVPGIARACEVSPDGTTLATVSDTLRLWDAASGAPRWRAPLLRPTGRLLTHAGPRDLLANTGHPAKLGTWEAALVQHGVLASESATGDTGCVVTDDSALELWSTQLDRRVWHVALPTAVNANVSLLALDGRCVVQADGEVIVYGPMGRDPIAIARHADAIGDDRDGFLVAGSDALERFDAEGHLTGRSPGDQGITALGRVGNQLALGHVDGRIELRRWRFETSEPVTTLASSKDGPVVRIVGGPKALVVAAYATGRVVVWDAARGRELVDGRLRGRPIHLQISANTLLAATDLGDANTIDLAPYLDEYCAVLGDVWQHVPVIIDQGALRVQSPPKKHDCGGTLR